MTKVTRVEVIDRSKGVEEGGGRVYTDYAVNGAWVSTQDDGRTIKVFINETDSTTHITSDEERLTEIRFNPRAGGKEVLTDKMWVLKINDMTNKPKTVEEIVDKLPYHQENTTGTASNIRYYTRDTMVKTLTTLTQQEAKKREDAVAIERERICTDIDEMWYELYGAYLNNQDLKELIKYVVITPNTTNQETLLDDNK